MHLKLNFLRYLIDIKLLQNIHKYLNLLSMYLSKSDFKVAQDCPAKLWYKKQNFPSAFDNNEYMLMLADGGYMVGKMAQLLYAGGILIEGKSEECVKRTEELLLQENVVLFEPAIQINNKLIRIDILVKNGNKFQLIEVKSKSFDSVNYQLSQQNNKKYFDSEWDPYFEDVTFQKYVIQEKFPESKIDCFLLLPDKSKATPIEGLISWFKLREVNYTGRFRSVEVDFTGDLEQLKSGHILSWLDVNDEVQKRLKNVIEKSSLYIKSLIDGKRIETPLEYTCASCEYKLTDEQNSISGFETCWKKLATAKDKKGSIVPHILSLGQLGNINRMNEQGINKLIQSGKVALKDIPIDFMYNKDRKPAYNGRPLYQLTEKKEFMKSEFFDTISDITYPLFFVDFETSQMAIPYHANMRPYEKVLFQWSCHMIEKPGAEPKHFEWINTEEKYPNIEFGKSLMNLIKYNGTILTWSSYENTQLKSLAEVILSQDEPNDELLNWLKYVAKFDKENENENTMILDMNKLALKYYFHPIMGGRTSIKVTLPAVLNATKSERIKKWLNSEQLYKVGQSGIINPYDLLPKMEIMEQSETLKDGSGAMRAYQDMLYGIYKDNPEVKETYKNGLLKYCKLDTLAMVIIWEHWNTIRKKLHHG